MYVYIVLHRAGAVPFSCVMEVTQTPNIFNYNYLTDDTTYKSGCREALVDYFGDTILTSCACIILTMFLLEVR